MDQERIAQLTAQVQQLTARIEDLEDWLSSVADDTITLLMANGVMPAPVEPEPTNRDLLRWCIVAENPMTFPRQ